MEMPKSIKQFELCYLFSIALGVLQSALGMNALGVEDADLSAIASGFALLILLLVGSVVVFTSRKKSTVGKWMVTIFFVVGIPAYIPVLSVLFENPMMGAVSSVQFLLQAFGLYCLFQNDAKQWFESKKLTES